jgi:hypothetical protein
MGLCYVPQRTEASPVYADNLMVEIGGNYRAVQLVLSWFSHVDAGV